MGVATAGIANHRGRLVDLLELSQSFPLNHGVIDIYSVQLAEQVLSLVAHMAQASLQLLHILLELRHDRNHLRAFLVRQLVQQRCPGLVLVLVVLQDAGEDSSVDVQSDVHQMYFSLAGGVDALDDRTEERITANFCLLQVQHIYNGVRGVFQVPSELAWNPRCQCNSQ